MTTEHFTLQGARAATTAESTGRATMFLGSVSAGLVALGLIAAATRISTAFYAFGLILLSTLSFVGFVTFQRVLQSGIEDHGYAERIARLRPTTSTARQNSSPTWPASRLRSDLSSRACGPVTGRPSGRSPEWLAS